MWGDLHRVSPLHMHLLAAYSGHYEKMHSSIWVRRESSRNKRSHRTKVRSELRVNSPEIFHITLAASPSNKIEIKIHERNYKAGSGLGYRSYFLWRLFSSFRKCENAMEFLLTWRVLDLAKSSLERTPFFARCVLSDTISSLTRDAAMFLFDPRWNFFG